MTEYRLMVSQDEPAIVALWSNVFQVPYDQEYVRFTSDHHLSDPNTRIMAHPTGSLWTADDLSTLFTTPRA